MFSFVLKSAGSTMTSFFFPNMYIYNLLLGENVLYVQVEPYLTNVTN